MHGKNQLLLSAMHLVLFNGPGSSAVELPLSATMLGVPLTQLLVHAMVCGRFGVLTGYHCSTVDISMSLAKYSYITLQYVERPVSDITPILRLSSSGMPWFNW